MMSAFGFGKVPSKPPKAPPVDAGGSAGSSSAASSSSVAGDRKKPTPAHVADIAVADIESVAQRSVKITFPRGAKQSPGAEDEIYRGASMFGTVMDIRLKGKNAVVLYSSQAEVLKCTAGWADTSLSALGYRAKAMVGRQLNDSTTSIPSLDDSVDTDMGSNIGSSAHNASSRGEAADGIAFEGPVMNHDSALQVLELEDVSHLDRSADASATATSMHNNNNNNDNDNDNNTAHRDASPQHSQNASRSETGAGAGEGEDSRDDSFDPYAAASGAAKVDSWKVADKPKTPPARPARQQTPSSGASSSGSSKVLSPRLVQVGSPAGTDTAGRLLGQNQGVGNDTYISSANDSASMSAYAFGNETSLDSHADRDVSQASASLVYGQAAANHSHTTSSAGEYSLSDSTGGGGSTFLTQSSNYKRPKPAPKNSKNPSAHASPAGGGDPLFGNILEIPSVTSTPQHYSGSRSRGAAAGDTMAAAERQNQAYEDEGRQHRDDAWHAEREALLADKEALQEQLRVCEAKERVMARERQEYGDNVKTIEERWSIEFMALGMRETHLREECTALREANQRAAIDTSRLSAEVAALECRRSTDELSAGSQRNKAEREAKSTLLAQQRTIVALTKQKEAGEAQVTLLKSECESLGAAYEKAVQECTDYKQRAAAAEEELAVAAAVARPEGGDRSSSDDEGAANNNSSSGDGGGQITALDRQESSSRRVLHTEMDRYLSLHGCMALPLPPNAAQAALLYQLPQRDSQFGGAFSAASEGLRCVDSVSRGTSAAGKTPGSGSRLLNAQGGIVPSYVTGLNIRTRHRFA